ncbi:MAG TPA: ORF6N domain-containing protein, partial [Verrucomicrobiae bacterium]
MADKIIYTPIPQIEDLIFLVRGLRAMLDSDLAQIYGVSVKRLNEQVRRNFNRFPSDFAFQ